MAETVLIDDAERTVTEITSAGWPDERGSTRSLVTTWKIVTDDHRRTTIETAVRDHLADLRTIRNSTGTLTGAQLSNAVRALAKGQGHVIRLLIGALESTE